MKIGSEKNDFLSRLDAPAPLLILASLLAALTAGALGAQPLDLRASTEGAFDYFATGAPLAIDGPDTDTNLVDTLNQPASIEVTAADVPATGIIARAYLYWAGTIEDQSDCATAPSATDDEVELTVPGAVIPAPVRADACYCAAGAGSYDIQACRADITPLVEISGMTGTFTVNAFAARITNSSTDNASFSIVLVYEEPVLLPPRRYALYDGLEEFYEGSRTLSLGGLDVDTPARGDLTWYVLDGDVGGLPPESVVVTGLPGGASAVLSDAINPPDNPMNRTINTTTPVQTDVLGVDIDNLEISTGLTPGDTSIEMAYTAGGDKYWVVYNIVAVNVYRALIHEQFSEKSWSLQVDADMSGDPSPGDTIRYTIRLHNSGTAPGYVTVTDTIPAAASSWWIVADGGGTNLSTATALVIQGIYLPAGGTVEIIFEMILAPGTEGTWVENSADFDAGPDGNAGTLFAPLFFVCCLAEPEEEEMPEPEEEVSEEEPPEEEIQEMVEEAPQEEEPLEEILEEEAGVAEPPGEDAAADTQPDEEADTGPTQRRQSTGCGCILAA